MISTAYLSGMPKIGPYSTHGTLVKRDGRTREARLVKCLHDDLVAHVGGKPSVTQRVLIDQACALRLRIALMERDGIGEREMSQQRQIQFLAWTGSLTRLLRDIGLEGAPAPKPTHSEWMASLAK